MRKSLFQSVKSLRRIISFSFEIPEEKIASYRLETPNFGFNGLGEVVFYRTYSRLKENGKNETFCDCIKRVVEGSYSIQKEWCVKNDLEFDEEKELEGAMFNFKFLPSGRGLFAMGTKVMEINAGQPLNSCAFVSTQSMKDSASKPFEFVMDNSMLGVGVGFDTKGAETVKIKAPDASLPIETYVVEDSRAGWVKSTIALLDSYFEGSAAVQFDYSLIRKAGEPLKLFGGICAGPFPLMNLHNNLRNLLEIHQNQRISSRNIVDIMNMIGKCVISGNIRRTAEIAFGEAYDTEFYDLKNYSIHPDRVGYGYTSRNIVFADLGMSYESLCDRIFENGGEPGIAWLENMKKYGRMRDYDVTLKEEDFSDGLAMGMSPGMEQSLESYEMCNLVETFPAHHGGKLDEFLDTLEYAMIYAKSVTLMETAWEESNEIMKRNRRLGVSLSGLAQFMGGQGGMTLTDLKKWCEAGYENLRRVDERISKEWKISESIKRTCIKPSKTISIVAGATPGMHFPIADYYIHRVHLSKQSSIIPRLYECGYSVDEDVNNSSSWLVEFPIHAGDEVRSSSEVSMWEKLNIASYLQENWADNQISCTITLDDDKNDGNTMQQKKKDLESALEYYQFKLKCVQFESKKKKKMGGGEVLEGSSPQKKFEVISGQKYAEMVSQIKQLKLRKSNYSDEGKENFIIEDEGDVE